MSLESKMDSLCMIRMDAWLIMLKILDISGTMTESIYDKLSMSLITNVC